MAENSAASASYGPTAAPPPNHLVWAVLSTVLFCLPVGVVAIVFASQVNGRYNSGDYAGAQEYSDKARRFALWSTILGVVLWAVVVALVALGVLVGTNTSTSY